MTAGGRSGTSPEFAVGSAATQYGRLVTNAVRYFTSERDGADVEHAVLSREPANLTDAHATVYAAPHYDSNDNLTGRLRAIGGPVNVSGGWFDAAGATRNSLTPAAMPTACLSSHSGTFPAASRPWARKPDSA